jgi:prolyl 4-hydroxylase
MMDNNFDEDFASGCISQIAVTLQMIADKTSESATTKPKIPAGFEAQYANFEYEPSRVAADNHITIDKHTTHIVARLEKPDIVVFDNLLTAKECDHIISLSHGRLEPSKVADTKTGNKKLSDVRTSSSCSLLREESKIITHIEKRIASLLNIPTVNGECLMVSHYQVGDEYYAHHDFFPPEKADYSLRIQKGGQRTCTMIMYLNDVEEGGEIYFPEVGFKCLPKKGDAVYFSYHNQKSQLDCAALHSSTRVTQGEKWVATKWFREKEYPYKNEMH